MYQELLALATFVGTIIGVGLFGLPYATARIGFIPMLFYFAFFGLIITLTHLMYGEITLRTKSNHRLPGYSRIYLGRTAQSIASITTFIGLTGSLLAYIIIGGKFTAGLLQPYLGGTEVLYVTLFFLAGAFLIYVGSSAVGRTDIVTMTILLAIVAILLVIVTPFIQTEYFTTINLAYLFLPYGIILFSLDGMAVIPEMREILKGREHALRRLIIIGSIIPIIVYIAFIILVYGVTGTMTTEDALTGLNQALGSGVISLGFLFGILTTFDSYITIGITLKKTFNYDWRLTVVPSTLLACMPAFILYLLGVNSFIAIISFIGAVALGIDIVLVALIYYVAQRHSQRPPAYTLGLRSITISSLVALFLIGVVLEILSISRG